MIMHGADKICANFGSDTSAWSFLFFPCYMCSAPCTKLPELSWKFANKCADIVRQAWSFRVMILENRSWKSDTLCSARNSRLAESARFSDFFFCGLAANANLETWKNSVSRCIAVGVGGAVLMSVRRLTLHKSVDNTLWYWNIMPFYRGLPLPCFIIGEYIQHIWPIENPEGKLDGASTVP